MSCPPVAERIRERRVWDTGLPRSLLGLRCSRVPVSFREQLAELVEAVRETL